MGDGTKGYTGSSGLMKLAFIMMTSAVMLQLFSMASGLTQATSGVIAMMIIAFLLLFTAGILTFLLYYLPETESHRGITIATIVLSYLAAVFIIIGMIVHAAQVRGDPPAYSTTLIVVAAIMAIGGATCMVLELTGKFTLTAPPDDGGAQPKNSA